MDERTAGPGGTLGMRILGCLALGPFTITATLSPEATDTVTGLVDTEAPGPVAGTEGVCDSGSLATICLVTMTHVLDADLIATCVHLVGSDGFWD